jgi:hypothetical protein
VGIRGRIERLEAFTPAPMGPIGPTTLDEIRALEKEIKDLEASMGPNELRESKAEAAVFYKRLEGLELDAQIVAIEREIEAEGEGV